MMKKHSKLVLNAIAVHSVAIFCLSLMLFVAKWFPYGNFITRLQQWLYRVF